MERDHKFQAEMRSEDYRQAKEFNSLFLNYDKFRQQNRDHESQSLSDHAINKIKL